jgi:chromosome segregation ATPase
MKVKLTSLQNFDIDIEELTKLREELAKTLNLKLDEVPTDLEAIKKAISSIPSKNLQQFANGAEKVNQSMDGVEANAGRAANGLR